MGNANWQGFYGGLQDIGTALSEQVKRKREQEEAIQMLLFKTQIEAETEKTKRQNMIEMAQKLYPQYLPSAETQTETTDIVQPQIKQEQEFMINPNFLLGGEDKFLIPNPLAQAQRELEQKEKASKIEIEKQIGADIGKKRAEAQINFDIAKGKLKTTAGAFKAMIQQEGAGRIGGFQRELTGRTGKNPYVNAFEGQLVEAAASLAKLAAPSARVGQEIIAQFKKTLPTKYSNWGEFVSQLRFSLHNAYATALGNMNQEYTPEIRNKVDAMLTEIINTPAMTLEDLSNIKQQQNISNISEEDIQYTMQKHGLSREEVLKRLGR